MILGSRILVVSDTHPHSPAVCAPMLHPILPARYMNSSQYNVVCIEHLVPVYIIYPAHLQLRCSVD